MSDAKWLTPAQVDEVIDNASTSDIIEAGALFPDMSGEQALQFSQEVFNRAAERIGLTNGVKGTEMIRARDFGAWTDKMGDLMRADNPLSAGTSDSPSSADTGE